MVRIPKLGELAVVYLLTGLPVLAADPFTPKAFPLSGLPAGVHEFRSPGRGENGQVFAVTSGVVYQWDGGWALWRQKAGQSVRVVLPLKSGNWVVAGRGFCSLVSPNRAETPILSEGSFTSGAAVGDVAIVTSPEVAYAVGPSGIIAKYPLSGTHIGVYAHVVEGRLVVFAPGDGVFVFSDGAFRPAGDEFKWARGLGILSLLPTPDGQYLAHSSPDLLLVAHDGSSAKSVLTSVWPALYDRLRVGAMMVGSEIAVATQYDGLTGYSADGVQAWQLGVNALGGNPLFLRPSPDGLMLGTVAGVAVVPDPVRFRFLALPDNSLSFVTKSSQGILIGTTSGVYHISGEKSGLPAGIFGLIETPAGFVQGRLGSVILPTGQTIPIAQRDQAVFERLDDGRILARHGDQLRLIGQDGSVEKLNLPFPVNSAAALGNQLLVGSNDGAEVMTTDGRVRAKFGAGFTRVRAAGAHEIAVDSMGDVFNPDGTILGRLPFSEVLSVTEWNGGLAVLARLSDGRFTVGELDLAPFRWRPYDLPLSADPQFVASEAGKLFVISPGEVMAVKDPPEVTAPKIATTITAINDGRDLLAPNSRLGPAEDTVEIALPPARLGPWANPAYAFRVGAGGWQPIAAGARVRVPRLPWGQTAIAVRASIAGLESTASFTIARARPWWARWPAFVLYAGALAFASWAGTRLRTRRLALRARELERIVDERTAELKQAQKAREEFFSTLSHEIRNPLNGVVGLCDILDEAPGGAVAPRERMLVRTLKGCASQLRSMLDDVLDFSRIDRGDIQLHEESFELCSAIEGATRSVDAGLAKCTLELPAPLWLRGDCGKFRQVLTNLVSNALKYGVPPSARVKAGIVVEPDGRVRIRVSVFNTGHTVPEKELERIFEGFVRGEDALRRRIPGSGLGLAVSRRMAIAMGGSLVAFSRDGLTEFRMETVMTLGEAPIDAVPVNAPKVSRALAIEDEPYNRLVLGHILSQLGYEVDWAVDGSSALERVRSESYDLLLTDYVLPDINGAELAKRILLEVPDPKPPVICVTAYSTPEKIAEARAAGISGFVTKPISRPKLEAAILSLGAQFQPGRSLDVVRSKVECDFSSLLRLNDGSRVLAEYADALLPTWNGTISLLDRDPEEASRAVHAFRSRILAVHANVLNEQLALLEDAVRAGRHAEVRRLVDLTGAMVDDIATAARARALASAG
jgi:signal transduction histidine kinase/CheY-like chemotaxis protein